MALDVIQLQAFYASPLGQVARRILSARLRSLWPDLRGFALAGVGYASAYLPIFRDETDRAIALMPAAQGVAVWPRQGPSASALIDPLMLPLGDASLDRVIIVHALEASGNPKELLSEIWQTLKPGGRIIVIAPNRRGLWARLDTTPFGQGQPFSRAQLTGLLREALFTPEVSDGSFVRASAQPGAHLALGRGFRARRTCLVAPIRRHPCDRGGEAGLSRAAGVAPTREARAARADLRAHRSLAALT